MSKPKELAAGNSDQNGSNALTLFRIYPLSRSDEKGIQTSPVESTRTPVSHKSVQCEIWHTNPSTCKENNSDEERTVDKNTKIGTTVKDTVEDKTTGTHSNSHSGHTDSNTAADCEQHVLKGYMLTDEDKQTKSHLIHNSGLTVTENDQFKTSNHIESTSSRLEIHTNCSNNIIGKDEKTVKPQITKESEKKANNQIIQPVGYPTENIIPDTPLILTQNTDEAINDNEFNGRVDNQTLSHSGKSTIGTVQTHDATTFYGEPGQNTNLDETERSTTLHGEKEKSTIPNVQTDKTSIHQGETNEKTTPDDYKTTSTNGEADNGPFHQSFSETAPDTSPHIPKLSKDIEKDIEG